MIKLIIIGVCFLVLLILGANGDRTSLKIYESIQSDIFCFRRLNATHQIGCASKRNGNVGVLYVIENEADLENIESNPPGKDFVAALPISMFNMKNMKMLKETDYIQGALVFKPEDVKPTQPFSPDLTCPNRNFGFYTENMNQEYAACKKNEWNKIPHNDASGMMFEDWGMPIFIITNKTNIGRIKKCYDTFNNGSDKSWPFCSVQMTSVMLAAKDSETCMRRNNLVSNLNEVKTCDPLSDKNVFTTLFPTNKSIEIGNKSVIVVSARLDAFTMFDKLAPGAHSTVTGLVTLLAIAKTMASLKNLTKNVDDKNVLFIIFNGEAFDYIGSSRVVYDMERGIFPSRIFKGIADQPALLNLHHLSHFIELSQMAPKDNKFWLHTDPVSREDAHVSEEVEKLVALFKSKAEKLKVTEADKALPLPPASFQSFLRRDKTIPGIVVADHEELYLNKFYNSIFDTDENMDSGSLAETLSNVANSVSSTLYTLLTNSSLKEPLAPQTELISNLLECYLRNASCLLFREIADPLMISRLRVEPHPLYVSVDQGGHLKANAITLYTLHLLAYFTGSQEGDRERKNCSSDAQNQIYQYDWVAGSEVNSSGVCIKSTVMYTYALSPAYLIDDWKSTEYSTWTESVWLETSARMFLQPGKAQEVVTLVVGMIIFLLSISSVCFVNNRSSIIFNTKPLVGC